MGRLESDREADQSGSDLAGAILEEIDLFRRQKRDFPGLVSRLEKALTRAVLLELGGAEAAFSCWIRLETINAVLLERLWQKGRKCQVINIEQVGEGIGGFFRRRACIKNLKRIERVVRGWL